MGTLLQLPSIPQPIKSYSFDTDLGDLSLDTMTTSVSVGAKSLKLTWFVGEGIKYPDLSGRSILIQVYDDTEIAIRLVYQLTKLKNVLLNLDASKNVPLLIEHVYAHRFLEVIPYEAPGVPT